ncbi:MAG: hypothetical protein JOZ33_17685 [Acidobacteriaceae bacterium]|nr:hypothetical protein [Acidobacteriaceae bacterium]
MHGVMNFQALEAAYHIVADEALTLLVSYRPVHGEGMLMQIVRKLHRVRGKTR